MKTVNYFLALNVLILSSTHSQTRYDVFVTTSTGDSLDATFFVPATAPPPNGYPVLLFVHGFEFTKETKIPSAYIYAQSGYLTFCYTIRGHGNSTGYSTILSVRERIDLQEVIEYILSIPNIDTNSIGIIGGSQGGLHGLWTIVYDMPVKAVSSDVIIPQWASDIFVNGAIRRTLGYLLTSLHVRYNSVRDSLWDLLSRDSYDSLLCKFKTGRDIDTTIFQSKIKPLMLFIKYQDHYFGANNGVKNMLAYSGLKKMYLGTGGHFSDETNDEWQYQFSWITQWFDNFLFNNNTGFLDKPKYTYAYSHLPIDTLGFFCWSREEVNELPINNTLRHRLYFHKGGDLRYSIPLNTDDYLTFHNHYIDSSYTFEIAYIEGFTGARFSNALPKRTLVFETSPLSRDVRLFGTPSIKLYMKSNSNKFPINIQMYEVDTVGDKYFITRINHVARNVVPDELTIIESDGIFHSHQFKTGNKIRIEITNIDITNRKLYGNKPFVFPIFQTSNNLIFVNENYASYIEIPLLTNESVLKVSDQMPLACYLYQNYPNPFNSSTTIEYSSVETDIVSLKIYDVLGKEVKTLFEGRQSAGLYRVHIDASNWASGVYFIRIQVGNQFTQTRKLLLLK